MSSKIKPGTYGQAKIKDYGISKTKAGKPCVFVQFEFVEKVHNPEFPANPDEYKRTLTWRGYLFDGSKERSVETLVKILGYKGKTGVEIANGIGSNALNETQEYELVVDREQYEGKWNDKIQWVNLPGGGGGKVEKIEGKEAAVLLGGMDLEGEFLAARANLPEKSAPINPDAEDDIDF